MMLLRCAAAKDSTRAPERRQPPEAWPARMEAAPATRGQSANARFLDGFKRGGLREGDRREVNSITRLDLSDFP